MRNQVDKAFLKFIDILTNMNTKRLIRFLYILISSIIFITVSCNKPKTNITTNTNDLSNIKIPSKEDSLNINVKSKISAKTGLNVMSDYFHYNYFEFEIRRDTTVTYIIDKSHNNQILKFVGFKMEKGNLKRLRHYYLINSIVKDIYFEFYQGDLLFETKLNNKHIIVDELFLSYKKLNLSKYGSIKTKEIKLNLVYRNYVEKFDTLNEKPLTHLNNYLYYDALQTFKPLDKKVDKYLKNIDHNLVASDPLNNLLYYYVKNRIDKLDFDSLKSQNFSKQYLKLLSIGLFNFLRNDVNIGKKYYEEKE